MTAGGLTHHYPNNLLGAEVRSSTKTAIAWTLALLHHKIPRSSLLRQPGARGLASNVTLAQLFLGYGSQQ